MIERTDRVNFSTLKFLDVSPLHYRHRLDNPPEDTDAMKLGRAAHCAILEPDEFAGRYTVMPYFHGGMNDETAVKKGFKGGKQAKATWLEVTRAVEVIDTATHALAVGMAEAVLDDMYARNILTEARTEQSIEWTDGVTGIECRGRVDAHCWCLSDIKTTRNIEPRAFRNEIAKRQMHAQLAFYMDGLEANGIEFDYAPRIISVENKPPHDVATYELEPHTLAAGRRLYRGYLETLLDCREQSRWPGVAGGAVTPVALPDWANPAAEITMAGEPLHG